MRKWRCIRADLSSKETAMVGDIFETDDKGMFKWRNGKRASLPIYEYTKYEFEEIKEEKKPTRDEMIYKIDYEYCDGRLCRDCVFDANCRDYDELSDEELIKDYNLAFNAKEEKEKVEMNKFKVGDVVEILDGTEQYNWELSGLMEKYIGTKGKIITSSEYRPRFEVKLELDGDKWWFNEEDMKNVTPSTQSFTITVSDTITTLKSADKTVEIKRYYTDKHDVKVAIDEVVKKYFDEVERINRPTKGKKLIGIEIPKGTKFRVINVEPHDDGKRVCMSEYIGKIGIFNSGFTFNKEGFRSSGTFEEEYMNAIDKKNGTLCWRYDEVEILWED